jgi:hypothetical protein
VNRRLAALLTRAHASSWRRRYGAEFYAVLEELPTDAPTVADAALSALRSRGRALVAAGAFAATASMLAIGMHHVDHQRPAPAVAARSGTDVMPCERPKLAWVTHSGRPRCGAA